MFQVAVNCLKPQLVKIIFKEPVRTSKRTHFTITRLNWVMLFKEIMAFYSEKYKKLIQKYSVRDCQDSWTYNYH
jgi:hypothetical protein